jgi:hypothetical protein
MSLESLFSLGGTAALIGWAALALSPLWPSLAQLLAARIVPVLIGLAYAALILRFWGEATAAGGGFGSLDQVAALFDHRGLLLAGWLHYLAFDLFVGAWEAREAERVGLPHWALVPALTLTFLFGPVGLLLFLGLRALRLRRSPHPGAAS